MTDKHTPGPWVYDDMQEDSNVFLVRHGSTDVAYVDREEDAELIARAPELLAKNKALEARVAELECLTLRSSKAALKLQKEITEMRNSMQTLKRITGG